jgi:hypothetical protein
MKIPFCCVRFNNLFYAKNKFILLFNNPWGPWYYKFTTNSLGETIKLSTIISIVYLIWLTICRDSAQNISWITYITSLFFLYFTMFPHRSCFWILS